MGCACMLSCSVASYSLWPHGLQFYQAPLSLGFSRQENCSGLLFSPPGDLPNPGIIPMSPASPAWVGSSLPFSQLGSPIIGILATNFERGTEIMLTCQNYLYCYMYWKWEIACLDCEKKKWYSFKRTISYRCQKYINIHLLQVFVEMGDQR